MATVIDEAESAFVPDRLITDNAVVAIEAFHNMQTLLGGHEDYIRLKLDLSKAFDPVEWIYLNNVMNSMNLQLLLSVLSWDV